VEAAATAVTVALAVAASGLSAAAAIAAFHLGRQEARRRAHRSPSPPWLSLAAVAAVGLGVRGLGLLWLRLPHRLIILPVGQALTSASGPLLAVLATLVLLGTLAS
jgi:hypothetical protein